MAKKKDLQSLGEAYGAILDKVVVNENVPAENIGEAPLEKGGPTERGGFKSRDPTRDDRARVRAGVHGERVQKPRRAAAVGRGGGLPPGAARSGKRRAGPGQRRSPGGFERGPHGAARGLGVQTGGGPVRPAHVPAHLPRHDREGRRHRQHDAPSA